MTTKQQSDFQSVLVQLRGLAESISEDVEIGLSKATKAEMSPRIDEIIDLLVDELKPAYDALPEE